MQFIRFIMTAIVILYGGSKAAMADCAVIDQLDKLYLLQSRLAANPDTALFRDDIRQLRAISSSLSERTAMQAVDGNTLVGKGADVVRFLRQTQSLLQRVSMDDPFSVQPHFTPIARRTLTQMADHLRELRCTDEQIVIAQAEAAEDPIRGNSDAEDLEEVSQAISQFAEDIVAPRNLIASVSVIALGVIARPFLQRWMMMRRRRAKRHNTNHATHYEYDGTRKKGALIDINCYGAKLRHEGDKALEKRAAINITIEGADTEGNIIWSNKHYSGVAFRQIISLAQVDFVRMTE